MRSSILISFFSLTLFFVLHYATLPAFAQKLPSKTKDTVTITSLSSNQITNVPIKNNIVNNVNADTTTLLPKIPPHSPLTRPVITITSISTVYPPIQATNNPKVPVDNSNSNSSSDGGPSGLVIGISLVGCIVLVCGMFSAYYFYRRHRESYYYDEGGEVVLRDGNPFTSTLDQYHR
ncbi:10638_t:CDS:1, partial [Scutellospora calospora]